MKTFSAKNEEQDRKWFIIDANKRVIGAVAVEAANLLRGKNKVTYTPHIDNGDHVVIINAEKAVFTGKKEIQKQYTRFSGYVGGQKVETPAKVRIRKPVLMVEHAVWGMIPKTRLGRDQYRKLNVYAGESHPHEAQNPAVYEIK